MSPVKLVIIFLSLTLLIACAPKPVEPTTKPVTSKGSVTCKDPRPEICTKEYRPVCATRDTGVRCVTTPCPSTERKTYATGCTACSDEKVISYVEDACAE